MNNWSGTTPPRWEMGRAFFLYLQSTDPSLLHSMIRAYGPPRVRVRAVRGAA